MLPTANVPPATEKFDKPRVEKSLAPPAPMMLPATQVSGRVVREQAQTK